MPIVVAVGLSFEAQDPAPLVAPKSHFGKWKGPPTSKPARGLLPLMNDHLGVRSSVPNCQPED